MKFNNWGIPWGKTKESATGKIETTSDDTKVFSRIKGGRAKQPTMVLVVTEGPDCGREFLLAPRNVKIGRQAHSHIQLKDAKVSREHALLQYQAKKQAFLLKDLGSTNGTFYNNCRITSTLISPGAEIRLGETVLKVIVLEKKNLPGQAEEESR